MLPFCQGGLNRSKAFVDSRNVKAHVDSGTVAQMILHNFCMVEYIIFDESQEAAIE